MHYKGHLREKFEDLVPSWKESDPEEVYAFLNRFQWCTDIAPWMVCEELNQESGSTYAQLAWRMKRSIREEKARSESTVSA